MLSCREMRYTVFIITLLIILLNLSCDKDEISYIQSESFIKFYGGPSLADHGVDVKQTGDKGYAVLSTIKTPDNGTDMCLILTDIYGNSSSEIKYFGGNSDDVGRCINILDDGGLILLGSSKDATTEKLDILLVRTNSAGDSIWSKKIGGSGNEEAYDLKIDDSGNFVLIGYTDTYDPGTEITITFANMQKQILILKVDQDGNIITPVIKPLGVRGKDDIGHHIQILDDGYLIIGNTNNVYKDNDDRFFSFITETNARGDLLSGLDTLFETQVNYYNQSAIMPDGNILVAGTITTSNSTNICLTKVNSEKLKEKLWKNVILDPSNTYNTGLLINGNEITLTGTHIISGNTSNIVLIRTGIDSLSTIINLNEYGQSGQLVSAGFDVTDDMGYVCTGSNITNDNSVITLIKTGYDGNF